jgi:hypothetical protein
MKTERRQIMPTLHHTLRRQCKIVFLVGAVLGVLLSSPSAFAAEQEGPVLFFSVEDLTEVLSRPSRPSFSPMALSFSWQDQHEAREQDGPLERNARGGDGLGVDGYTHPGERRPLWGY